METSTFVCPSCGSITAPDDVFCGHCGAKLNRIVTVGLGKQIWIYFVSLFLPPFGLLWVWRYLRLGTPQQKRIGWIALGLTILGILLTIWATAGFLSSVQNQMNSYSNLGL